MKIGFKDADEREQKWMKASRKTDILLYKLIMGIVWLAMAVFLGMALYHVVRILVYKEDTEDLLRYVSTAAMCMVVPFSLWLIGKLIDYIQKKNIVFWPPDINPCSKKVDSFTLRDILVLMQGKPMQWLWDFALMMFLVGAIAIILSGGSTDIASSSRGCLILIIMLLTGHFLFLVYYLRRPYEKMLVRYSKEYFPIDSPEHFCQRIDQSIKMYLCFCSKQFCFTKDLFLGYTEADTFYHPAAIYMEDIEDMEFYVIWTNGRAMVDKGILACKLKNGNIVDFYIGSGKTLEITLNAMDGHGINYKKNHQPVYSNFGRR